MNGIENILNRSVSWLLKYQDKETGGWGSLPGNAPNTLNTAETILALLDGGAVVPANKQIQKAISYLKANQILKGKNKGAWPREIRAGRRIYRFPDIVRASFALQALIKAGVSTDDEHMKMGILWLFSLKKKNSGWSYRKKTQSKIMPTCLALLTLIETYKAGMNKHRNPIMEGVQFLLDTSRQSDGSFEQPSPFQAVHTIYAVLVLQALRKCNLGSYLEEEDGAIEWLLRHPDNSRKVVEENIPIDPDGNYDYGFMYMTDFLLMRVLMNSKKKEFQKSELAQEVMICLKDKMDESGGFYGYRVFSWATAKALLALNSAISLGLDITKGRKPEYPGKKLKYFIGAFASLLAIGVVVLTMMDKFTTTSAIVFTFLMLAVLVGFGAIGEKTFKEITVELLKFPKKK